jgi:hypothetical protein
VSIGLRFVVRGRARVRDSTGRARGPGHTRSFQLRLRTRTYVNPGSSPR